MKDDLRAPIFATKDERDRWQILQYGAVRDGFRTENDRTDERPLLVHPFPFWRSADEKRRYETAVRLCPPMDHGQMDMFAYLREVASVAEGMERVIAPEQWDGSVRELYT